MFAAIELGSSALTLEGFFKVCFCRTPVVLDASVCALPHSSVGNSKTDTSFTYATLFPGKYYPMPSFFTRAYILSLLSLLIGAPTSVSLTTIQGLVRILNGPKDIVLQRPELISIPNRALEKDLLDQLLAALIVDPTSPFHIELSSADIDILKLNAHALTLSLTFLSSYLMTLIATLQEAAMAFSFEVFCASMRELFESTNYTVRRKLGGMKSTTSNLLSLLSGSKKLNQKKNDIFCSESVSLAGETRELAESLRVIARADIAAVAYTDQDTRPLTDANVVSLLHAIQMKLPAVTLASTERRLLVNSVTINNGAWKALPDELYEAAYLRLEEAIARDSAMLLHNLLLPIQLCQVLKNLVKELLAAFTKLSEAQASLVKGRIQVGQGVLITLDTYGELLRKCQNVSNENWFSCVLQIAHAMTDHLFLAISNTRLPQPPCGMRDLLPEQMIVRQQTISLITDIFQRHGAVPIETPVMESRAVLLGKYGEEQRLIYNIADYGEEPLSLRYDLTVPFARYCATHREKALKRYSIGRVYRRDKPVMEKGRFREFYQCDLDIVYEPRTRAPMVADAEVIVIVFEILSSLQPSISNFIIMLSHRTLLDAAMTVAGVLEDQKKAVCSCIDQLDKLPREEVKDKIIKCKGINPLVAETILILTDFRYSVSLDEYREPRFNLVNDISKKIRDLHASLALSEATSDGFIDSIQPTLEEMALLFKYAFLMCPESLQAIVIDLSLARGLDYYTGMIFEAKMLTDDGTRTGSIAGGGRYDELLGKFRAKGDDLCAVGGSIGIERIFAILDAQRNSSTNVDVASNNTGNKNSITRAINAKSHDVYICGAIGCTLEARLTLAGALWKIGIAVGMNYKEGSSQKLFKKDLDEAVSSNAIIALILGGDEIKKNVVNVKNLSTMEQVVVPFDEIVDYCTRALAVRHERFALMACKRLFEKIQQQNVAKEEIEDVIALLSRIHKEPNGHQ